MSLRLVEFMMIAVLALTSRSCRQNQPDASAPSVPEKEDTVSESVVHTIAMVGDMMLGNDYVRVSLPPNDGKDIFCDAAEILKSADIAAGNLEGTIGTADKCRKDLSKPMAFAFRTPESYTHLLSDAGFDFVNIANNHIYDFFDDGAEQTERALEKAGIMFTGRPECRYAVKEVNGSKFGFCSFGHEKYTLRTYEDSTVVSILRELRPLCDVLIVCFHGGAEGQDKSRLPDEAEYYCGDNRGHLRRFAHLCIDNGADIVFGSGPHVPRCVELYNKRFIAYSLGNFVSGWGLGCNGKSAYAPLIEIKVDGNGEYLSGTIHSLKTVPKAGPRTDSTHTVSKHIMELTLADIAPENVPQIELR